MKRRTVLGMIVLVGGMSIGAVGVQQPAGGGQQAQAANKVEVEKLRDNLFVLRGGGGNTAVFVQKDGVTVVDTKNPGWGRPILDAIRGLTDKPVTTIVNTHTHGDHVSGNVEFPASVAIVTHENTRENMKRMASPPGMGSPDEPRPNVFAESKGRGMPTRTFKDRLTLGQGADRVDLWHFGRGHTNGDAIVVFPALRTLHMGDLFPGKRFPLIDSNNGGSGVEYPGTLRKAHDQVTDAESVITGHSTVMTRKDLLEYSEFMRDFVEAVRAGHKAGRSAEEIANRWSLPEKYAGYTPMKPDELRVRVEIILKELQ